MSDLTDDQILLLASTEKGQNDPSIQEAAAFIETRAGYPTLKGGEGSAH